MRMTEGRALVTCEGHIATQRKKPSLFEATKILALLLRPTLAYPDSFGEEVYALRAGGTGRGKRGMVVMVGCMPGAAPGPSLLYASVSPPARHLCIIWTGEKLMRGQCESSLNWEE